MASEDVDESGGTARVVCQNEKCPRGVAGQPKEFVPQRRWAKFCCNQCRMAVAVERRRVGLELLKKAEEI